jgi:hypothetical protein
MLWCPNPSSQIHRGATSRPKKGLNHRSTDYEAMQDSARRLTFKHLSSVSAEPKLLFFIFILDFTLPELSDDPDIRPVVLSIALNGAWRRKEEIGLALTVRTI